MKTKTLPLESLEIVSRMKLVTLSLILSMFMVVTAKAQTTVVDVIVNSEDHTSLEAAVIAAELDGALSGDGPFTVFAPTDDAFAALGSETIDALFDDPTGALASILQYHVVAGNVMAGDLSDGQIVEMLEGTDAFVSLYSEMAYINQAMITVTDITADNGVVHVIDAVITQPTSIVDIVVNSPRHETLEAAVIAAELDGALSADGTFTLFAPTDDAFAALGDLVATLLEDPTGQLAEILKYHVVGATAMSGDLSDGDMFTTLEGSDIDVTINDDGVFINDAQVIFADYEAPNGVVHVIDAVITPPVPSNTVVDVIVNSEDHTSLEAAVIAAELDGALSGDGPFTVFAPTDDAFAALGSETIDALFDDPTGALASILQYHVVAGNVMAGDLSDGQIVEMLEGTDAFVSLYSEMAYINQAMITVTDITADNGVVHVIDAVITQPTSIVDIVVNSPRHETLEAAVIAAELDGALSADGTFTLFAPTDDAFAALGDLVATLLEDPTGQLAEILKYHVVGATAMSGDLSDGDMFTTLEGSDIDVTINDDGVFINDAQVIFADYEAPNGVVHVIDAVITPPSDPTGIEEVSVISKATVYPNPASDRFTARFELNSSSEVSIDVYDIVGQKKAQRYIGALPAGAHEYVMSTDSMEDGLYIIIVNSGQSAYASKVRVVR